MLRRDGARETSALSTGGPSTARVSVVSANDGWRVARTDWRSHGRRWVRLAGGAVNVRTAGGSAVRRSYRTARALAAATVLSPATASSPPSHAARPPAAAAATVCPGLGTHENPAPDLAVLSR